MLSILTHWPSIQPRISSLPKLATYSPTICLHSSRRTRQRSQRSAQLHWRGDLEQTLAERPNRLTTSPYTTASAIRRCSRQPHGDSKGNRIEYVVPVPSRRVVSNLAAAFPPRSEPVRRRPTC